MQPFQLRQRLSLLNAGAVIAYPTETVWGLGCLPNDEQALQHLAQIKRRSLNKGFILVSPNIEYCLPYINSKFHLIAKQHITLNTEQATTWLIPKSQKLSSFISGQFNTVAIRISPHPFIQEMCDNLLTPLVSTSANIHARPSLNSSLLIARHLGHKLDHIVYGYSNGSGQASTIIDCQSQQIIRA